MVKEFGNRVETEKNQIKSNKENGNGGLHDGKTKIHYLNFGEEDQMEISGYQVDSIKQWTTWTCYLVTLGILRLIFHWYPQWELYWTHSRCPLNLAQKVLITDNYKGKFKSFFVKDVEILTAIGTRSRSKSISCNGLSAGGEKKQLTVYLCDGTKKKLTEARVIRCKKLLYIWDNDKNKFVKLAGLEQGIANEKLHSYKGYTKDEQTLKRIVYGYNDIEVPVQSILQLLILEALTPFYIFQVFSIIVWLSEEYFYYMIAIIVMSVFGISTSIVQTRRNQTNLKGTVHSFDKVMVARQNGLLEEVPTADLVPGDLIVIPRHGCEMHCDAVLLNGNCIVNESMLTGESVPITKTALPNNTKSYSIKEHNNHTLFCGTKVIQTRFYGSEHVTAVVIRTGYLTSKGELVRSIMYPPPADFKFDQDSYKFIMILAAIAFGGFLYTVCTKLTRDISATDILIKALDLITIVIPPALPAAMTVGKLYALNRLRKYNIYCINSRVINVSGSIDCVCFDKTGTLTEDGLDMWGIIPIKDNQIGTPLRETKDMDPQSLLFQGMLTCHSITLIDGELCGDPLDTKMFESTGWVLEEPEIADTSKYDLLVPTVVKPGEPSKPEEEIGILQQYQFSSTLQRMSVISRRLGSKHFEIFCKGSPEMIMSLSKPETIPEGITEQLKEYTEQGYRVIGMGTRKITADVPFHKIPKLLREEVECDLEFVGLIVLENRLKPETTGQIDILRKAGMKIVMITGDNILTGVSVARECGIIQQGYDVVDVVVTKPNKFDVASVQYHLSASSNRRFSSRKIEIPKLEDLEKYPERKYHFVITGNAWADLNHYFPELIPKVITKGVVFARMSGHQKQQLIEELQNLGYYVAMCGDGANDCGALKAAHVGISLSDAESSVASPFTSREPNISCTAKVIQEGRAALVTSFGVFKVMLCYSLTEFASCIILYSIDSNLTSLQFLFVDIPLVLHFAASFGMTRAHPKLHNKPPMMSLLSFIPLTSIVLFMIITVAAQAVAYYYVQTFPWFTPFVFNPNERTFYTCYENYAVFSASLFQYITLAIVFAKGKPYRKPMFTNYIFTTSLTLMLAICIYITLDPANWIIDALELKVPPVMEGRYFVLVIAAINFLVCYLVEEFVEVVLQRMIVPRCRNLDKSTQKYLKVERDMRTDPTWPVVQGHEKPAAVMVTEVKNGGWINGAFDNRETKF